METLDIHSCQAGKEVTEKREMCLGVPFGTLPDRSFRQVRAAMATALDAEDKKEHIRSLPIPNVLAKGFNHSSRTHAMQYSELCKSFPGERILLREAENARIQDQRYHIWTGAAGWGGRNGNISSNPGREKIEPNQINGWRHLRLVGPQEALGLLRLGGNHGWESRPLQQSMVIEAITGARDALFIQSCGGGKSSIAWIFQVYAIAVSLARLDDSMRHSALLRLLQQQVQEGARNCQELATTILADDAVIKLFEFAKKDPTPPPKYLVSLVLVPTEVLKRSAIQECNRTNLMKARELKAQNLEEISNAIRARETVEVSTDIPDGFHVLVLTTAFAITPIARQRLEEFCESGMISAIIYDEVDSVLLDRSWRNDAIQASRILRGMVPIYGLTGTLQNCLVEELGHALNSRLGRQSTETGFAAQSPLANEVTGDTLAELQADWVARHGIQREVCTIPGHIRHSVINIRESMSPDLLCTCVAELAVILLKQGKKAIQIVLPSRSLVDTMKSKMDVVNMQSLPARPLILALKSGDNTLEFAKDWMAETDNGQKMVAVTTTAGSRGTNCGICDCVILYNLNYGLQLAIQSAHRAGRKGQSSDVIFLKSKNWNNVAARNDSVDNFKHVSLAAANVNTADPAVKKALSRESLKCYLSATRCRRLILHEEMDDGSIATLTPTVFGSCCDVCDPNWASQLYSYWEDASKKNESRGGDRIMDEEAEQTVLEEQQTQRRLQRNEEQELLAFFTSTNHPYRCYWHDFLHANPNESPGSDVRCRHDLLRFFGNTMFTLEKVTQFHVCHVCGDYTTVCLREGCFGAKLSGHCVFSCCGISRALLTGFPHANYCPGSRTWMLLLWALRSGAGHARVQSWFSSRNGGDIPDRTPFSWEDEYDENIGAARVCWGLAMEWISIHENNTDLWKAIFETSRVRNP
jgi:hypothetical protein